MRWRAEKRSHDNRELKQHVEHALEWDPSIDQGDIGVAVDAGVVTLRGNVRSYGPLGQDVPG